MHLVLKDIHQCNNECRDNLGTIFQFLKLWRISIWGTFHLDSGDPSWSLAWFQRRTWVRFSASPCPHFAGCRRQAMVSQTLGRKVIKTTIFKIGAFFQKFPILLQYFYNWSFSPEVSNTFSAPLSLCAGLMRSAHLYPESIGSKAYCQELSRITKNNKW